ncbi:MAG: nitroreductase family protein [Chitinophagaceae bacterium]|jgi:nitroreductase/dihydropteridine reductase
MSFIKNLEWRYACKKMNGTPVPEEKVNAILRATQLAPTSMGLQPFTVLVITDSELRKKIQPIAYNQAQVVDGSHLLVFCAWSNITPAQIEEYISLIASTRNLSVEGLSDFKKILLDMATSKTPEQNYEWAARQAYIAFGAAIAAAAIEQVDTTPMEGFNPTALDELLGLPQKGLRSVLMLPLGYRDEANDWLAKMAKVRRPADKLFVRL